MDHEHPLQEKPPGAPYTCSGCKQLGFGSSYHCQNNNCTDVLHGECAYPDPSAVHPFFENSVFKFHKEPPGDRKRLCDACGKDISGFVYHCSTTEYDLHPCCLKLKNITDESGSVTLKLSNDVSKCVKCKHRRLKGKRSVEGKVKGWCYIDDKKRCYHVACFKDLIFENCMRVYFPQKRSIATTSASTSTSSDRETQLAVMSVEEHQRLRISWSEGTKRKSIKIAILVFKLIFSAICGNPMSAFAAILEALVSG